jgi:hypothetical protein
MKRLTVAIAACLLAVPAIADMTVYVEQGLFYYDYDGYRGGVFNVTPQPAGPMFRTFCVEATTFTLPGTYIATIDDDVWFGDGDGSGLELLTDATKNVYARYADGILFGIYANDDNLNDAVQAFLWDEQLILSDGTTHRGTLGATAAGIYDALASSYSSGYPRAGLVRALNLWDQAGGDNASYNEQFDAQSQLVMIPAPGAAVLAVIGLGLVARIRRWV